MSDLSSRMTAHREAVTTLREQTGALETLLRETTERSSTTAAEQLRMEARMEELRQLAGRLVEESARELGGIVASRGSGGTTYGSRRAARGGDAGYRNGMQRVE